LLLRAAWILGIPITVTAQYPKGLGPTDPDIAAHIPPDTPAFDKTVFSCCGADGFNEYLAGVKRPQIVIAGMEAHVCVLQSAFDLLAAGYQVFVLDDATCSRKLENYHNALLRLHQGGAIVTSAESVVFEWLRDARHVHFKTLSSLIR
jgi:nicotinamidase-related amidase